MDKTGLKLLTVCTAGVLALSGCANAKTTDGETEAVGIYEAEEAQFSSNLSDKTGMSGFSGSGYQ